MSYFSSMPAPDNSSQRQPGSSRTLAGGFQPRACLSKFGDANAAHTVTGVLEQPTPVALDRRAQHLSWAASAARMPSASASHRRVEPSTSVNRNVTTPEGGPPADTRKGCHTKPTSMQQTATDFRDPRIWSISRQRRDCAKRRKSSARRSGTYPSQPKVGPDRSCLTPSHGS
jgi:hypothetical protein